MSDSKTQTYIVVGIVASFAILSLLFLYVIMQSGVEIKEATVLSIVNGVATSALVLVSAVNMMESKKVRGEMVRPHLSLEPSFFKFNADGEIAGFNSLNLVNSGTVARDIEIDISIKEKSSLFYASSIGASERVQIWSGEPEELGNNVIVAIRYKNIFNKSLQEVLSININSLNNAKRKFLPIHKS